jgi:chemotaxis protein CheD
MNSTLNVGLGEHVTSKNPDDVLVAYGLGSCLGIGMIDPLTRIAGLLHAVLPDSNNGDASSSKYVTSGIRNLMEGMVKLGANQSRIIVRMAGGANMLVSVSLSQAFEIGSRNIIAAHKTFQQMNMRLSAEEVGGNVGRTVKIYVVTGKMTVRMVGGIEHEL